MIWVLINYCQGKKKKERKRKPHTTDLTLKFVLAIRHSCPYGFTGKPQTKTIPEQHTSVAAIDLSGTSERCLGTQISAAMVTQLILRADGVFTSDLQLGNLDLA